MQIGRKAPPHFCLLVRYSACIAEHDVTSRTNISCIIEPHIGCDLAEKLPLPPLPSSSKFIQLWFGWQKNPPPSLPPQFIQIHSTLGSAGRKAPLPPLPSSSKFIQLWFGWQKSPPTPSPTQFIQIHSTLVQLAEKPSPPSLPGNSQGTIFHIINQ